MHKMKELKDMLYYELMEYIDRGRLKNMDDLCAVDKLTHSIKSIDTILAMEDAGYSSNYSYGRGRYAKRDSMGRYSKGYDRDMTREELMDRLHELEARAN